MKFSLRRTLFAVAAITFTSATYQNCAPMTALNGGATDSSSFSTSSVIREADISWSMRQGSALFNRFDRATRWPSMQASGVHLYPPLITSSQVLDVDSSGLKETKRGSTFLRINPDASMAPAVADTSEFTFDEFSIVFLVNDVNPPTDVAEPVRLFDMMPADGSSSGRLVLDVANVNGGVNISIVDWFSSTDYAHRSVFIPADKANGVLAISARFSKDVNEMTLAVNGELASVPLTINGTIPPLGWVARNFILHAPAGKWGAKGSFLVGEIGIHKIGFSNVELQQTSAELAALYNGVIDVPVPTATPIVTGTPVPNPVMTPTNGLDGAKLYLNNCQSCHNPLASSTKRGKSVSEISSAINLQPQMSGLSSLSQAEREAIAAALR